jgi:DNA-binding YbaB/EbfC family protein
MAKGPKGPSFRGGISEMMRYANRIQQKLGDMKEAIKDETLEASAAGGRVTAVVNGERKVVKISIDREKVDLADLGEVEDLIAAAVNMALEKMDEHVKEETKKITGGMDLPGLF